MRASCQPLVLHSTHIFIDVEGEEVATHFRIRFSGPAIPLMIVADFVDQTHRCFSRIFNPCASMIKPQVPCRRSKVALNRSGALSVRAIIG
jgi:hypothetical protein